MKITMESTDQTVDVGSTRARVWQGTTENGVKVQCLVLRVAVHKNDDNSQFERELEEHPPRPFDGQRAFDPRFIL